MLSEINVDIFENKQETIKFLKDIQPKTGIFKSNYSYGCYVGLYLFALQFCKDKNVLDGASGLGYGSYILTTKAKNVIGVDLLENNISNAAKNYKRDNLKFLSMDLTKTEFKNESFDTIVSIETFEHIPKKFSILFIDEMIRILKPGGKFIISTPNKPIYDAIAKTPDHVNELDVDELHQLLSSRFEKCEFYYQRKNVLKEMKAFYSIVKIDKFKIRQLIPKRLRQFVNKFIANDLTKDIDELLPNLLVHKADSLDDVKNAVKQIVVCEKYFKS